MGQGAFALRGCENSQASCAEWVGGWRSRGIATDPSSPWAPSACVHLRPGYFQNPANQRFRKPGMTRKYFGTDGIRGTVGQAPITPDFVLRLAHAVGRVLRQTEDRPTVLIGKDTRISGYMLESALESGFNSAGVD